MRSSWPSSTRCPGWARSRLSLPSARTLRVCSVVIAPSRIKGAPRSTCSPSAINTAVILPGMGARRPLRRVFRYLPRRIPGSGRLAGSGPWPSGRDGLPSSQPPSAILVCGARRFSARSRICSLLAMKSSLRESISLPNVQVQAVVDRLFLLGRKLVEDLCDRSTAASPWRRWKLISSEWPWSDPTTTPRPPRGASVRLARNFAIVPRSTVSNRPRKTIRKTRTDRPSGRKSQLGPERDPPVGSLLKSSFILRLHPFPACNQRTRDPSFATRKQQEVKE